MKTIIVRLLLLPAAAVLGMASCADTSSASRGPGPGVNTVASSYGTGFVTYSTVPAGFVGTTYYHQGRYFAGGRYEPGSYTHEGRVYPGRYFYNGRYYYGGVQRQHGRSAAPAPRYAAGRYEDRRVKIGALVDNRPMVDTTTSRNADIYNTAATRGPMMSFRFD